MQLKSVLTKSTATVLQQWISDPLTSTYSTSVAVETDELFSICEGVVAEVSGNMPYKISVIVQFNHDVYFRYLNVDNVTLVPGTVIHYGDKIGDTIDHRGVFEALTTTRAQFGLRVGNMMLFKENPMPYLKATDDFETKLPIVVDNYTPPEGYVPELTPAQADELTDGRERGEAS